MFLNLMKKPGQTFDGLMREFIGQDKKKGNTKDPTELAEGLALEGVALGAGFVAESISQQVQGYEYTKDIATTIGALAIGAMGHRAGGMKGKLLKSSSNGVMGSEGARLSRRVFKKPSDVSKSAPNQSHVDTAGYPYPEVKMSSAFGLSRQVTLSEKESRKKDPALEFSFF